MPTYSTPGVYVEEISTFPPSVAEVSTAIPAFIGYTASGDALSPVRIGNMKEYEQTFGGPPNVVTSVTVTKDTNNVISSIAPALVTDIPVLYYSLRLYFDNGGGPCYIVSTGSHASTPAPADFQNALAALEREDEPTLIVIPDATRLSDTDFNTVCVYELDHCGKMRDRFAILDVKSSLAVTAFRTGVSPILPSSLSYGAAYAPYLDTALAYSYDETVVTVGSGQTSPPTATVGGITATYTGSANNKPTIEIQKPGQNPTAITCSVDITTPATPKLVIVLGATVPAAPLDVVNAWGTWKANTANNAAGFDITKTGDATVGTAAAAPLVAATNSASALSTFKSSDTSVYNQVKTALAALRATLPPSGAIAGIYASVDRDRGVWKAPANVGVASVISLDRSFTDAEQGLWNIDPTSGKSINIIRTFTGRGTLVWGARTLAGNDNEWRYVPVRRLFIMIEESTLKATAFAVFEPNVAETWLKVKAMIQSFLYGLWEQGALAGTKPEDAYFVNVGLGSTMTAQDILQGSMIVEIGVAAVRPAEFIILRFSHKMQQS
jgi:phage tail sheath protein FI